VNIEAADRIEESAELITAAEIAPKPIVDTTGGVRVAKTIGKILSVSPHSSGLYFPVSKKLVSLQSVLRAIAPIIIGGIDIIMQPAAAKNESNFA